MKSFFAKAIVTLGMLSGSLVVAGVHAIPTQAASPAQTVHYAFAVHETAKEFIISGQGQPNKSLQVIKEYKGDYSTHTVQTDAKGYFSLRYLKSSLGAGVHHVYLAAEKKRLASGMFVYSEMNPFSSFQSVTDAQHNVVLTVKGKPGTGFRVQVVRNGEESAVITGKLSKSGYFQQTLRSKEVKKGVYMTKLFSGPMQYGQSDFKI